VRSLILAGAGCLDAIDATNLYPAPACHRCRRPGQRGHGFQVPVQYRGIQENGRLLRGLLQGPDEISAYLTSANPDEYPPGFIDPEIVAGDHVAVYGLLKTIGPGDYDILLVGSEEYYIKPASS